MHIGLASLPLHGPDVVDILHTILRQASHLGVMVVCANARSIRVAADAQGFLDDAAHLARDLRIALIIPLFVEETEQDIVAILSPSGNPIAVYSPQTSCRIPVFDVAGLCCGIVVEDALWRRSEPVHTLARRGAQVIFHVHGTVLDEDQRPPRTWCDPDASFHEKTLVCRSAEVRIPLASVGPAHPRQAAATAVIAPDGSCLCHHPYGQPGLLVHQIQDVSSNLGCLA